MFFQNIASFITYSDIHFIYLVIKLGDLYKDIKISNMLFFMRFRFMFGKHDFFKT